MKLIKTLLLLLPLLFFSCSKDPNVNVGMLDNDEYTDQQLEILEAIQEEATPINQKPLAINDSDLKILDQLADARLVGLGEATHGTKEFFQMKQRVFQYLVENHGFDAFLFEMDVAEGRIFNDWVQWRRDDDIAVLMEDKMLFSWVWLTEEVKDVLEYIRSYNDGRDESDMIGFYGVDTQFPNYDLLQLVEILNAAGVEAANQVRLENENHINLFDFPAERLTEEQLALFEHGLNFAKRIVDENESKIISALGDQDFKWAKRLVLHMEQVQTKYVEQKLNNNNGLRDQYMAENTSWYFDLLGQDAKFVLWAHNGHLANSPLYAFTGSQGSYLKKEYGEDYQILGFSFAKGKFTARDVNDDFELKAAEITQDPQAASSNYIFYQSSLENFILPMNTENSTLKTWLSEARPFLSIGAIYNGNPNDFYWASELSKEYDFIIHFDKTTNSEVISL